MEHTSIIIQQDDARIAWRSHMNTFPHLTSRVWLCDKSLSRGFALSSSTSPRSFTLTSIGWTTLPSTRKIHVDEIDKNRKKSVSNYICRQLTFSKVCGNFDTKPKLLVERRRCRRVHNERSCLRIRITPQLRWIVTDSRCYIWTCIFIKEIIGNNQNKSKDNLIPTSKTNE